jgi:hypothetical protein
MPSCHFTDEVKLVAHPVGKSSPNGCGTFAWNWGISFILSLCARPSLHLLACPHKRRLPTRLLPRREMDRELWPCPGNEAASLVETSPSSQMGGCTVLPGRRSVCKSGAKKWMEACLSSLRLGSANVASVRGASPVNSTVAPPRSRAFVSLFLHPLVPGSACTGYLGFPFENR